MPEQLEQAATPVVEATRGSAATQPRPSIARAFLRSARPKQWAKNVLLLAAPGAAGVLDNHLFDLALAVVAFCLVSSGTYFLNDARDIEGDRQHPTKRHRPIAAGDISLRLAVASGVGLLVAGFLVAALLSIEFVGIVALYVALTTSYTLWLKEIPVIDIVGVASGFIVRAVAGGVAVDVPLSRWFVIVASFGSLFMVAGKRHGEHLDLGPEGSAHRATLAQYSRSYLQYVWTVASGITILAYCLWAFEQQEKDTSVPWFELSIVPFVVFILRYAQLVELGRGGTPEDIVFGDRMLKVFTVIWALVFGAGVYLDG